MLFICTASLLAPFQPRSFVDTQRVALSSTRIQARVQQFSTPPIKAVVRSSISLPPPCTTDPQFSPSEFQRSGHARCPVRTLPSSLHQSGHEQHNPQRYICMVSTLIEAFYLMLHMFKSMDFAFELIPSLNP